MKAKQMHWGYDGGGFGCGPVEGTTVVELAVTTEKGENFFIANARCHENGMLYLSPYPLFDLFLLANESDADFEQENDKIEGLSSHVYDYALPDYYPNVESSPFLPAIQLTFMAMEQCYPLSEPTPTVFSMRIADRIWRIWSLTIFACSLKKKTDLGLFFPLPKRNCGFASALFSAQPVIALRAHNRHSECNLSGAKHPDPHSDSTFFPFLFKRRLLLATSGCIFYKTQLPRAQNTNSGCWNLFWKLSILFSERRYFL